MPDIPIFSRTVYIAFQATYSAPEPAALNTRKCRRSMLLCGFCTCGPSGAALGITAGEAFQL
jgi:hypothetical protein